MFEKIYERIDELKSYIRTKVEAVQSWHENTLKEIQQINIRLTHMPKIEKMENTIASQQRTIEALTNALQDKYEKGLFIYSEDCEMTKVIRNGKELTNPHVRSLCVSWELGCAPEITIDEIAGTFGYEEE
jgi:hypothetical protein